MNPKQSSLLKIKRRCILCIFLYCCTPVFGQQRLSYDFRHIDRTNGLLHNEVTAIAQDNKGFIWIGTVKGLQRYDGLRFKNYNDDRGGIVFKNEIQTISAVGHFLWLTSAPETEKLDINTNSVTRHVQFGETTAGDPSRSDVYTDAGGNKYLLDQFEFYRYNSQSRKMVLDVINAASRFTSSQMVNDESRGQVWIVSPQGLLLADRGTRKIYSASHNAIGDPLLQAMKGKSASGIMLDSRHNTWITSRVNDQLYRYDPAVKKLFVYSLVNIKKAQGEQMSAGILYNNCVFEDDHANIWVATQLAGLLKYNNGKDNFDYVLPAKSNSQSIQYNYNINCIFQDNQENIWLGTDKGINVFNPYRNYFQTIQHEKANPASLPQNDILGFIQTASGDMLIATWGGGISIYDSSLVFKKNVSIAGAYEKKMVWCFLQKDDKNIWAGCQHGYLHTYNMTTGNITTIHPPAFEHSTIRCMLRDRDGNAWFGLHNGRIAKWDRRSAAFVAYNDSAGMNAEHFAPVQDLFIDSKQHFWASTEGGLKLFDPIRRRYTAIYQPGKPGVSATTIQGIGQYNDSLLLIGSRNDGLFLFNLNSRSFLRDTTADELRSGSVYAIKKDHAGNIWLTADYTLFKFNVHKGSTAYAIEPDVINSSFESLKFYPLRDGRWVTATSAEAFLFNPDSLAREDQRSKVVITGFRLFDHPLFIDSMIDAGQAIPLSYRQNFVTIEFSALSFLTNRQTPYHYRLSGVDKDWVNANGDGFASYTNLSPGKYVFSVKAGNDAAAPVTTISLVIASPWYKQWWFILIYIASAGALAYRWIKMREKSVKTQMQLNRQQYKMAEAEMNALRAQMNPHFLFNSLNSINNFILKNDAENAAGYLTKFSRLMRLILENSRGNWVWLQSELKALQLYVELEAFRFDDNFTYQITTDADIQAAHVMVPPMIIQPYVENAIWHGLMHRKGGGGHLQIDIRKEDETLCITIKDNGVGREAAGRLRRPFGESHKSHGMKITAERLEIMNKVYHMEAQVRVTDVVENGADGTGTLVSIRFKYTLKNALAYDSDHSR